MLKPNNETRHASRKPTSPPPKRITPETKRCFTGPRRKQALTQHTASSPLLLSPESVNREVENSSRNKATTQTTRNPSLTLHTVSSLNFISSESINRSISRSHLSHQAINYEINRVTTRVNQRSQKQSRHRTRVPYDARWSRRERC